MTLSSNHSSDLAWDAKLKWSILTIFAAYLVYSIATAIYNITLHPLAGYPGPVLWRASRLPSVYRLLNGQLPLDVHKLHIRYGHVVRIAPNELAYASSQAWQDIYGHKRGDYSTQEFPKFQKFYAAITNPPNIVTESTATHKLLRRLLSPSFSDRAMQQHEPIIKKHIEQLLRQLKTRCVSVKGTGVPLDLNSWFNSTTFDIIGDLTFSKPFGSLVKGHEDLWVRNINRFAAFGLASLLAAAHLGGLTLLTLLGVIFRSGKERITSDLRAALDKRIHSKDGEEDLTSELLKAKDNKEISHDQLVSNVLALTLAGSETAATQLSGIMALLLQYPNCLSKLCTEVRESFASVDEITATSVAELRYLKACLNEGLRMYPPSPFGVPRQVHHGGNIIDGRHVPQDTLVAVWIYSANRNPRNFANPDRFCPERWLTSRTEEYMCDNFDAMQPFSVGPRDCIGRNLSLVETRMILASLLLNFDFDLVEEKQNWFNQRAFLAWKRKPLYVTLSPRKVGHQ